MTPAPSYLIERLDYAGRRTRQEVFRGATSQHWEVLATDARGRHQHSAHRSATLADLVAALPQLHRVTRGVVWIRCAGLEAHDLLGALRVVDAAHEPAVPERWFAEPSATSALEAFRDEDDEFADGSWGGALQLVPRWIRVNDERAVVARGGRRAALLLLDEEGDPVITRPAFEWGFYGVSGGPCSWDGGAAAGWCGPSLWVRHRWGDLDPERSVSWAPPEGRLTGFLADVIESNGWSLPFIRGVVGFPGLGDDAVEELVSDSRLEGQWLTSSLPDDLDRGVLRQLCRRNPTLRGAVTALRRPTSARGRVVYAELRELADLCSSWNRVDEVLLGGEGSP